MAEVAWEAQAFQWLEVLTSPPGENGSYPWLRIITTFRDWIVR